jgi:putative membrane-bound dehydrogenase-like protein
MITARLLSLPVLCALMAGCGKPKPPLSPQEEAKTFRLPPGFRAELAAAEPQIADAVSIVFDPSGRMYAAEMPEYPLDPKPLGRIKLLEDRDGDGRYEHAVVFADQLHFPEGILPWRKGVLVACAPDLLYLEDTDGDGRSDVRKVVMTGFATGNPQLRLNNPVYGIDNWIYAAHPRPPVPRRYVKEFGNTTTSIRFPERPDIAPLDVRAMDVRFRPDRFEVERVSGNSQFGHGFDAWGNRFTVWNNDHVRHVVIQNEHLVRNPFLAIPTAMESVSDHEPQAAVFPITEDPLVIHDTQAGRFTSACGLSVYAGGALPADFENNSFTCEPVHNLVHRDILKPHGATFAAKRAYERSEFMRATDAWFRPVFTTTGPDGALYVVDFYRYTVEHPEFVPPQLLKQINFAAGQRFGRIWRLVHESSPKGRKPNLAAASTAELVAELANSNMWWRINAQRLLVERQDKTAAPALEKLALESPSPYARLHALWTLDGLGALDNRFVLAALAHPHGGMRFNAVRLAETRLADPEIKTKVLAMTSDGDARVQFQVACALTRVPGEEALKPLQQIAAKHAGDRWFQAAVLASAADNVGAWFRFALTVPESARGEFVRRVASIAGARRRDGEIAALLRDVVQRDEAARIAALNGLADGVRQGAAGPLKLAASQPVVLGMLSAAPAAVNQAALRLASLLDLNPSPQLAALVREAAAAATNASASVALRECSAGILGLDPSAKSAALLARLVTPSEPHEVQMAAAAALGRQRSEKVTPLLLERWRGATGKVRDTLLASFFADQKRLPVLLEAIGAGTVQPWAIGPARTRQLLQHNDPAIRKHAQAILTNPESDRKAVYEKYLPAITMPGRPERGREIYEKSCAECHKVGDAGQELGPDLRSVSKRYKETLLADVLMPNQNIEGGYEEYLVETTAGREITGILARETPTTLTLRRRKSDEDTILRSSVKSMRSLSLSPMPEDLEKSITVDQMADLIAYIKSLK